MINMKWMFYEASLFNQDLNKWDVSKVSIMSDSREDPYVGTWPYGMFDGAYSYNQPLNAWDVSKVTNLDSMFAYASRFNQELNAWDVSKMIQF